ncbi:DegV family protein [Clostridium sp. cel8]|uniref:DegV family protein n=1 Tax=Clostridium sp. cel8 TaxID=2663123 RepID=UPI0015F5EDCF|nr:DegV family protein [Clostridium sp. cel8]MBA5850276.1 DegV family protein [Clostridium sp. cel8]
MEKIALITDSTSDLPEDMRKRYNVNIMHYRIIYKDREYLDKVNITSEYVYNNLHNEIPKSSIPPLDEMESTFSRLEKEGYTHAIVVTLSSGLTGFYNGIKLVSENHPKIKTYICDSKSISIGESIIIIECAKLIERGFKFDDIVKKIPKINSRIKVFFIVGTLEYLKKGGRIGKVAGTVGEFLNIKPIVSIDQSDGKYYTYDKVRGRKKSITRMIQIVNRILDSKKCRVYVVDGCAAEDAKRVLEGVKNHVNAIESKFCGILSPVAGAHSGPGLVGIALFEEE